MELIWKVLIASVAFLTASGGVPCVCKRISLGRFKDFEEAVKVRKAAEDEYFRPILKEVARDNSQ